MQRFVMMLTALMLMISVTSCASSPSGDFCERAQLLPFSDETVDVMQPEELRRVVIHNRMVLACPNRSGLQD